MAAIANPTRVAKAFAKPIMSMQNNNSTSNTFNLSGGLTVRDVDKLMDEKINRFANRLEKAMGVS